MLRGKKILIGITGSIAAYKALILVRELVLHGAEVKVIMTKAATEFVTPLSFSVLSKHDVICDLSDNNTWSNHVMLGRWADIFIIAPLTANTLAKMSSGICDNMLLATYFSATCPVWVAPAMDEDMWKHKTAEQNIEKIKAFGNVVLPVVYGELASGLTGAGRMSEPETIIEILQQHFSKASSLLGKRILITAGPTHEPIDPVRYIGNNSSGKMGMALAERYAELGATVMLILGPVNITTPYSITIVPVVTASEMREACLVHHEQADIIIMCAAVADYKVKNFAHQKIKKLEQELTLELEKNPDILYELGQLKKPGQILCGFALETNNEVANAQSKLERKNLDFIVLNSLQDAGSGFGHDTNKITIFDRSGNATSFPLQSKKRTAENIVATITPTFND